MANPFSLTKMAGLGVLVAVLMALVIPMAYYIYQPPGTTSSGNIICATVNQSTQNSLTSIVCLGQQLYGANYSNSANSPEGYIFNLTKNNAFPSNSANGTGGLLAGSKLQNSIGLAFVYAGIGTLIQTVTNFGTVIYLIFGSLTGLLPNYMSIPTIVIINLVVDFFALRLMLLGISAWSKFDLINT